MYKGGTGRDRCGKVRLAAELILGFLSGRDPIINASTFPEAIPYSVQGKETIEPVRGSPR
jgi:hypothetical protein